MSGGSQPISSSRPTVTQEIGALQAQDEAGLGFDEMRVRNTPRAIDSTSARSPAISRAMVPRSSVVATTLSFACAWRGRVAYGEQGEQRLRY